MQKGWVIVITLVVASSPFSGLLTPPAARASSNGIAFVDEAAARGIVFHRAGNNGSTEEFRSVTGSGVCWADFNGDGLEDLYFVNSKYDTAAENTARDPHAQLFRNNGDGSFTDVTNGSGADLRGWMNGCAVADYNNDGLPDIFVAGWGENTLLKNLGGFHFANVTLSAGVSSIGKCSGGYACWGQQGAFGDADGDGCLDLYVGDYVRYDPAHWNGNGPGDYEGQENFFFHNNCNGTFTDETASAGLSGAPTARTDKTLNAEWGDYDRDGRPDLLLANDESPMILFHNNGDGTFTDVAKSAGIADTRANMGLAFDDVNGDGKPDVFITHYSGENRGFYLNRGGGTFADHSNDTPAANPANLVGWGTGFIDYNNDGYADIYVVNGHTIEDPVLIPANESRQLFANDGTNTNWTDVSSSVGSGFTEATIGRSSAVADLLLNGSLAIAISNEGGEASNLLVEHGVTGNWLDIELAKPGANRFAIGAEVTVTPAGLPSVMQVLRSGTSFDAQDGYRKHFGLGASATATVQVRWPDGLVESWPNVSANEDVRFTEGNASFINDTLAPVTTASTAAPALRGWFQGAVNVTLTATDRGVTTPSGVVSTRWSLDGGAWHDGTTVAITGSGRHSLAYDSVDAAGNREPVETTAFALDSDPPTTTATENAFVNGWATANSSVSLAATDATSGVHATYASVDDAPLFQYTSPIGFTGEGERTLAYFSEDLAGNNENEHAMTVPVDTVPPKSSEYVIGPFLNASGTDVVTSASAIVFAAVDGASGVAETDWRETGGAWQREAAGGVHLTGADGLHTVAFRSIDVAGNVEPTQAHVFRLDNHTPPPLFVDSPWNSTSYLLALQENLTFVERPLDQAAGLGGLQGPFLPIVIVGPVPLIAHAGADVSGVAWTRVSVDGRELANATGPELAYTWYAWTERAGWHTLTFATSDGLGNVRSESREVVTIPVTTQGILATLAEGPSAPPGP
ncbi:MAG: CRTAC1 family protein [Thermoplasmatota archaeon]